MSTQIPRPSIGRVVIFTDEEGDHPAIVLTECPGSLHGAVDLVFAAGHLIGGRHWRSRNRVAHVSSGAKTSFWRYPDRVEGTIEVFHLDEARTGQTFDGREVK